MSGLMYTVGFENQSVSAIQDLIEGVTSSACPITIHRVEVSSDATALEQLRLQLLLRTTAGSGGSSITPRAKGPKNSVSAASSFNRNVTTPGTAGNPLHHGWRWGQIWNFDYVFGKAELVIEIPASTRFALALLNAPGSARAMSASIDFEER